jgi:hypothetical protein
MTEGEIVVITIRCGKCDTQNTVALPRTPQGQLQCTGCLSALFSYQVRTGFVYILSNPKMPGLLKIGYTARPVEERVQELNAATGVPAPFVIEAYFPSETPDKNEAEIYRLLSSHRIEGKEFFEVGLDDALSAAEAVTGLPSMCFRTPRKPTAPSITSAPDEKAPPLTQPAKEAIVTGSWTFEATWSCDKCKAKCSTVLRRGEEQVICPYCRHHQEFNIIWKT